MDESAKEGAGEREPQQPDAAKAPANEPKSDAAKPHQTAAAADNGKDDDRLPVVWSPRLDAGDDIAAEPAQREADDEPWSFTHGFEQEAMKEEQGAGAASAESSRSLRFALLAASVAIAAAVGSFAGTHWMVGAGHSAGAKSEIADANTVQALKAEIAELNALKASLDASTRGSSAQIGKLGDRLDRLEHAQAEPTAKLAHIADAVDRLEKRTAALPAAAPETTGSIATSPPSPPAAQPAGAAAADLKLPTNVLHEWVVQNVQGGRALVENRYGGMFDVAMGSILPGLGRVDAIKRQDGEWIVVTPRGLITSTGR
jgi:hypothetical protein